MGVACERLTPLRLDRQLHHHGSNALGSDAAARAVAKSHSSLCRLPFYGVEEPSSISQKGTRSHNATSRPDGVSRDGEPQPTRSMWYPADQSTRNDVVPTSVAALTRQSRCLGPRARSALSLRRRQIHRAASSSELCQPSGTRCERARRPLWAVGVVCGCQTQSADRL